MGQQVQIETFGPVGVITLNRPQRHNSLVPEFLAEFLAGVATLRERKELRAMVLQGNGRSFSTGGDVRAFHEHQAEIGPYAAGLVQLLNDAVLALLDFPVPIVAAVHGIVTGGSLGLVLASDIVLVAPEATFTPYYSVVGFSPDGGWTALLPQVIGPKRTAEVLMRNLTITAEQAVAWGLAGRVVPADQIHAEARKVADEIAAMQPGSIRATRRLMHAAYRDAAARLAAEHREFCAQVVADEAREGMAAFLTGPGKLTPKLS
ncbi:MAG TPA: enoyl-CoA hydratase/isomerase family protein [Symbiobacteriaceae bacterium]